MSAPVFIERLYLRNFASFHAAQVNFSNPLFLVGRNGSGKSNLLKALDFLSNCMWIPLQQAFALHGGADSVVTQEVISPDSPSHRPPLEIRVDFSLTGSASKGYYSFSLNDNWSESLSIGREQCWVGNSEGSEWFSRVGRNFYSSIESLNPSVNDSSLIFPTLGGTEAFLEVFHALSSISIYDIDANLLKNSPLSDVSYILNKSGDNVAGVLQHLKNVNPNILREVAGTLATITPEVLNLSLLSVGNKRLLTLIQGSYEKKSLLFGTSEMSRGTLSALGLIVAAMQTPAPSVLCLEEPENNLHPGAMNAISDLIETAAEKTQVIVTTHSPDLLDAKWIQPENIRIVAWEEGSSLVLELGPMPKRAMQEHLHGSPWYAGQLLRANALDPVTYDKTAPPFTLPDLFEDLPM